MLPTCRQPRRLRAVLRMVMIGAALAAVDVRAEYVYHFRTAQSAPAAGPVSGGFNVCDAAIADGVITADEIDAFSYSMQQASAPFKRATFAPPNPLTISGGQINVDPTTGALLGGGYDIQIVDSETGQTLDINCDGRLDPGMGGYAVSTAGGAQNSGVANCDVAKTISTPSPAAAVPAAGTASLLALAAVLAGVTGWHLRRRSRAP